MIFCLLAGAMEVMIWIQSQRPGIPGSKSTVKHEDLREARTKVDDHVYSDEFGMIIQVNGKHLSLRQSWMVRSLPYVKAANAVVCLVHLGILS